MKNSFLLVLFVTVCYSVFSQAETLMLPKLSPRTQQYLLNIKKSGGTEKIHPEYVYKKTGNNIYMSALVKVNNEGVALTSLQNIGAHIGTKAGNIWTVQVPINNVQAFTRTNGIAYIELDEPVCLKLDSVRIATHVDSVQKGINLPMAYTGKDVILGIVDVGFDFNHPDFLDTTGTVFRIKKVWEEKGTGTPPAGFAYGSELNDTASIKAALTDNNVNSHGTHVAGIAGGSGRGSSNTDSTKYRGMAFETDMVMVGIMPDSDQWQNTGVTDFLDGMNYVYTYAAAQGKPAVVNLSWGSPVGPHDGTSLFSQACDALTGRGKIFVCAAGNEGDTKVHLHKLFTSTDSVVNTFVTFQPGMNPKNTWVDVWGEQGKTFCAQVSLYHDTLVTSTGYVCLDNTIHEFYLVGTNHDTCYVTLTTSTSEFNGKPRIYLSIGSKVTDSICLSIKSFDGEIHAWNGYVRAGEGYFGDLTDFGKPWATPGDVYYSITDIASTHSAITAGAYAAKTTYRSIGGGTYVFNSYDAKLHDLAPFSSRGPGVDGTIKPDITAPGICVVSSVNSNDASFKLGGSNYTSVVSVSHNAISNKNYYYAQLSGTSMATPATSGIIALMLQANHNMNPDEIKTILAQTAITDTFTGNIPAQGNTNWGHGKINAYSAVIAASALATGNDNLVTNDLHCNLYPNPNNGFFSIEYNADKNETLQIDVYDITGKVITTDTWAVNPGYNKKRMLLRSYEGLYFVKISSAQNRYSLLKNLIIR